MRILRSPAGLALRTAATTFVAAGAVTVLTVSVATRAASFVVAKRQESKAVPCSQCTGNKCMHCTVCKGDSAIDWSPFPNPASKYVTLCPLCGGTGLQRCMNCLGTGKIVPML